MFSRETQNCCRTTGSSLYNSTATGGISLSGNQTRTQTSRFSLQLKIQMRLTKGKTKTRQWAYWPRPAAAHASDVVGVISHSQKARLVRFLTRGPTSSYSTIFHLDNLSFLCPHHANNNPARFLPEPPDVPSYTRESTQRVNTNQGKNHRTSDFLLRTLLKITNDVSR